MDYTRAQKEYIDAVDGKCHNIAVTIIGVLEKQLIAIGDIMMVTKCNTPVDGRPCCPNRHKFDGCRCCECMVGRLEDILEGREPCP